jgi:hypothetical protein
MDSWTHDLERLVQLAGVGPALAAETKANPALQTNWSIVRDWTETDRYDLSITRTEARDLYSACTSRRNGVLLWIRQRW